jgi:hypothetical protein
MSKAAQEELASLPLKPFFQHTIAEAGANGVKNVF